MNVEVNAHNIEFFGLDILTGNTKEDLLRMALEAKKNNHVLTCEVPIDNNVFDAHGGGEVVEPAGPENSQQEGSDEQEEFHSCELPEVPMAGSEFKCKWCRRTYIAEPTTSGQLGVGTWVIKGEPAES